MHGLTIVHNLFDQSSWETVKTDDICATLQQRFLQFPHTARIYQGQINLESDVTPHSIEDIEALQQMEGDFYCVVYPGDPATLLYVAFALIAVVAIAVISSKPKIPNATSRNYQSSSPNNALSGRTNQARINNRIPDIYGTVRSTPDLIAVPYSIFKAHVEFEYCYMCIGRGSYELDADTVRDGQTVTSKIEGESVEVFGPNTSPNTGDAPQLRIGPVIDRPVISTVRSKSVNGQTLLAVNDSPSRLTATTLAYGYPQWITTSDPAIDFTSEFSAGQTVIVTNGGSAYTDWSGDDGSPEFHPPIKLINTSGTYVIESVLAKSIKLVNPAAINSDWDNLQFTGQAVSGGYTGYGEGISSVSSTLLASSSDLDNWVGPFVLDVTTMNQVICNYVALNGMYKDDGVNQLYTSVDIQMGATPCDAAGVATGPEVFFTVTVQGSSNTTGTRAATLFADLLAVGRYMVRSQRLTPLDLVFSGSIVDEVKWRDAYASSPVGAVAFGNVTTVHAVTQATQTALAVSERQLNMLVVRKLPVYDFGSNTFAGSEPTNNAADIISAISLDTKIGNRKTEEVDFLNIYETMLAVVSYFGIDEAAEFCYTFDTDNLSYEEMLVTICSAVFCRPQRQGRVIEIQFEQQTDDSALLFNHRNKVPGTETRTATFGPSNNNDGIEYSYVSDVDDAVISFYVPENRSAVNPKKIESIGVRSLKQAHLHSYREYNKLRYQVRTVSFDALQESEIVSVGSRILVADNTRPDTQDGHIEAQDGFVLTLSQPIAIIAGTEYVVFLQLANGFVEILPCSYAPSRNQITLLQAPSMDLVTDDESFVKTLYQIIKTSDLDKGNNKAFLLQEKSPNGSFINSLTAINYDNRYYANDQDFA